MAKLNLKTLYVSIIFFGAEPKNRLLAPLVGCTGNQAVAYQKALKRLLMQAAENDESWLDLLNQQAGKEMMGSPEWVAVMRSLASRIRRVGYFIGKKSVWEMADMMHQQIDLHKDAWEHRQQ